MHVCNVKQKCHNMSCDLCAFLLDPFATVFGSGTESFGGSFADFRNLEKVNLIPLQRKKGYRLEH